MAKGEVIIKKQYCKGCGFCDHFCPNRYAGNPKVGESNRAAFEKGAEFFMNMGA